jgi:hypothetical protein
MKPVLSFRFDDDDAAAAAADDDDDDETLEIFV